MFWFDKSHPNALYIDNREVEKCLVGKGKNARNYECKPNIVMDYRSLDFPDNKFNLVVFDPPHFLRSGEKSYMAKKYGKLDPQNWKEDFKKGRYSCKVWWG